MTRAIAVDDEAPFEVLETGASGYLLNSVDGGLSNLSAGRLPAVDRAVTLW